MNNQQCECPDKGYTPPEREFMYNDAEKAGTNHKPNECKGTNEIKLYERNGKKLYLCSCCNLSGDKLIN